MLEKSINSFVWSSDEIFVEFSDEHETKSNTIAKRDSPFMKNRFWLPRLDEQKRARFNLIERIYRNFG